MAAVVDTRVAMTTTAAAVVVVEDGAISSLVEVATPVEAANPTVVEATVVATRYESSSLRGARACRHDVGVTISD